MRRKFSSTQRNYIIAGLCMILVIMGVGYAAFQSQLKISGTSNITSNWSVKITNIESKVVSGAPTDAQSPSYTDTTATFKTRLTSPGDTMQYDVTVSNEGDIDAKLDKITVPESNNPAIGFEVKGIREGSLLEAKQSAILTVIVKYNDVTEQPSDLTADLEVTLDYSQAPEGYIEPIQPVTIGGQEVEIVESGDGLYKDEYEEGKYTYKGANPNNYITFNNEMWRVISIDSTGLIKIIRNEKMSSRLWDIAGINDRNNANNTYCQSSETARGCNAWAAVEGMFTNGDKVGTVTEDSSIKHYLNGEYLSTLSDVSKVVSHTWGTGAVTYNNNLSTQIESENKTVWNGQVGLITVSEYLRASNQTSQCGTLGLNNANFVTCRKANWLFDEIGKRASYWTISPSADDSSSVYTVEYYGTIGDSASNSMNGVYPVLYLSSDITLIGEGTESNPYVITN